MFSISLESDSVILLCSIALNSRVYSYYANVLTESAVLKLRLYTLRLSTRLGIHLRLKTNNYYINVFQCKRANVSVIL